MSQEGWSLDQEEAPCTPTAPAAPSLCLNNCGFFGSPATMNLCSSCYKTLVLLKPPPPASPPAPACAPLEPEEPKIGLRPAVPLEPASSPFSSSSPSPPPAPAVEVAGLPAPAAVSVSCEKIQPLRCFACQKKVVLRGFKCRCGDVFCALHRYSDKHSCSFDYKAAGRASIEKANPIVKADKLHRI